DASVAIHSGRDRAIDQPCICCMACMYCSMQPVVMNQMLISRPMMASAVATQHQVLAVAEARRAPSRSPRLSAELTLLENTIATMPSRPSGQHRQVARMVEMIDQAGWSGTGPCRGSALWAGGGGT